MRSEASSVVSMTAMAVLWDAYGRLRYGGEDGERAKRAIEAMEVVLRELERAFGVGPV